MAENSKKDENAKKEVKKTSRKIKATTGAWWKSTVIEEEVEPVVQDKTAEKKAAKKESTPQKRSPRKQPSKKVEPEVKATSPATGEEKTEPEVKKTPRKRPARKKKIEPEVEPTPGEESGSATETGADTAPVTEPDSEKPKRKTTPKRTPRRRSSTKAKVEEQAAAVEESEEEKPESESAEEPIKKQRTPRKRSTGRKKKTEEISESSDTVLQEKEAVPEISVKEEAKAEVAPAESKEKPEVSELVEERTAGSLVEKSTDTEDTAKEEVKEDTGKKKKRSSQRKSQGKIKQEKESVEDVTEVKEETAETKEESAKPAESVAVPDLPDEKPEDEHKEEIVLKLLINAEEPEECRLALLENGRLESIHVSTINRTQTKNNIYKARIVAIEPNLQAAFVDYGTEKNGFLPFSEIHPEYYKQELSDEIRALVESHHWKKLSITDVVEKGQDVMVQVVKEEVGKKGANMTTYLSLPGRSVVLMPGSDSSGISRKISGEERRNQLRTAMNSLGIPEGIGWIVRTASVDITKTALARDVGYLLRLWEEIKKKAQSMEGVGQLYEDHQSVLRFLREHFDPSIEEILVDDEDAMDQVKEFISLLPSKQRDVKVRMHKGSRPIFNQFSVEDQIESIYQPKVNLPSGGSIVIEPTEALVSIDVNSGSTSKGKNFDQSIYQANLEAASELARQLRLRDLGGLIVVDFIDMRNKKHIRDVERMLKSSMKRDKAKVDFSRISKFGLMQISRQKLGSPIEALNYRVCQHCKGRGTVRSVETLALFYLRRIQTGASRKHVGRVECRFPLDVAQYLLNNKRHEILEHETRYNTEITVIGEPSMSPVENDIILHKAEKDGNDKNKG